MTTRTRIIAPVLLSSALVVALAGCVPVWGMTGAQGPRVTDERDIDLADSVVLETSGDLVVTVGDEPALTITAPEGMLDRLTSEVVDGTLVLGMKGPGWGSWLGDVTYELTVPTLSDVQVEGSGDVEADFTGAETVRVAIEGSGDVTGTGIDATDVEATIDGSGEIDLAGTTETQRLEIAGSGSIDTDQLESRDAVVEIGGTGDVDVYVTETLDAEISGTGELRHRGGATVTSDVSGLGDIIAV
jgi:hypothetical protein